MCLQVCVCAHDKEARNAIYYLHHSLLTRLKCVCFFENREWVATGSVLVFPLCQQVVLVCIRPVDRRLSDTHLLLFPFPQHLT